MPMLRWRRLFSNASFIHKASKVDNVPFEFSAENQQEITKIIARYPPQYKKAAVIPLLLMAQKQNNGWTSLPVMNKVAEILEMPSMRVYEVATFYTMFNRSPIGKFHVQVCTTTPCMLKGAYDVLEGLEKHLGIKCGEKTEDGMFTLGEIECAGACVNAPMMSVNEKYFEDLSVERATEILDEFKAGKTPPAGPQNGRRSCEPLGERTTLLEDDTWDPEAKMRKDF